MITSTIDKERSFVPFKNDVTVLLVNNLGGLSGLELDRVVVEVRRALGKSGTQIMRLLVALLWFVQFIICVYLD
jgi:dihydroxyacetone kinase